MITIVLVPNVKQGLPGGHLLTTVEPNMYSPSVYFCSQAVYSALGTKYEYLFEDKGVPHGVEPAQEGWGSGRMGLYIHVGFDRQDYFSEGIKKIGNQK